MLIQFSVGNYRSFKEPVTLSMVAAKIGSKDKEIDANNVFEVDKDLSLLTSAAIYGANASGKSNLVAAIRFMRRFVLSSSRDTQAQDPIVVERFRLSTETEKKPSSFEMVFRAEGKQYRYGFEVDSRHVVSEWLFHVPKVREARLFERKGAAIRLGPGFREGRGLEERTRPNALFLSVAAQFNGAIANSILRWFYGIGVTFGLDDGDDRAETLVGILQRSTRHQVVSFIKGLDLGIIDVEVAASKVTLPSLPEEPGFYERKESRSATERFVDQVDADVFAVKTLHWKYDAQGKPTAMEQFDLEQNESEGTKKLFALSLPVILALREGRLMIVDELDARLHPLIICEIIKLFNSRITNPHHAQLIFTTHDTNLLSSGLFRRDQIWFTEKSVQGATTLYSLVEYRLDNNAKVRNDASYERNYIEGRYGAIPFIGDLRQLIVGNGDVKQPRENRESTRV